MVSPLYLVMRPTAEGESFRRTFCDRDDAIFVVGASKLEQMEADYFDSLPDDLFEQMRNLARAVVRASPKRW